MKAILELLIPVLLQVESGGDVNAIGDSGKAVGCLQIHEIMVDDVNRIAKMNGFICHHTDEYIHSEYSYDDRYLKYASTQMCEYYLNYYYDKYVEWYYKRSIEQRKHKTSPLNVYEVCARLWNGGYEGLKKNPKPTDKYWNKVLRLL